MLFFTPPAFQISPDSITRLEDSLRANWAVNIDLSLAKLGGSSARKESRFDYYFRGIFNYCEQYVYRQAAGPEQSNALAKCLESHPDFIFLHRLWVACAFERSLRDLPPIYFDLDDVEHVSLARHLINAPSWPLERLRLLQVPALMFGVLKVASIAKKTFVCSDSDKKHLQRLCNGHNIVTIPNAVELPPAPRIDPGVETVLFIGSYTYPPNVAAAECLIREIWPLIKRSRPSAKLLIAGGNPELIPSYKSGVLDVEFTGFVENLDHLYSQTSVVCCPIKSGSGTRIKILEAGSYGVPVVSTTIGAEGLELAPGDEILLADSPEKIAESCIHLLENKIARQRLGNALREAVSSRFQRKEIIRRIQAEFSSGCTPLAVERGNQRR